MKASAVLVIAGSLLAAASPIEKRILKTKYITDVTYVTVTVDAHPVSMMGPGHHEFKTKSSASSSAPTTSSTSTTPTTLSTKISSATPTSTSTSTTPPPAPTTSSTTTSTIPVTTPTTTPAPAPTTSSTTTVAPVEVATTTPQVAAVVVEATTAAAITTTAEATTKPTTAATTAATTKTTTTAAAASTPSDFSSTAVYHHNLHRANHSAPDVAWNSDLASYAATVAAKCVFAHDLTPGASTGSYGQNIATYGTSGNIKDTTESEAIAESITNMWYNGEVNKFPSSAYGEATPDMTNFEDWGHFSQLVWVASTEVGCAVQYCDAGTIFSGMASWFSVCNYRSAGNVKGSYGKNVLPSLGKSSVKA